MPQLDVMTFFTQFFWFSLGFSFFYIMLLHFVIPSISLVLKYRRKKLEFLALDINQKKENVSSLLTTYDNIIYKAFNSSKNYFAKVITHSDSWMQKSIQDTNSKNDFAQANSSYLKAIGEKNFNFSVLNVSLKNSEKDSNWTKLWTN